MAPSGKPLILRFIGLAASRNLTAVSFFHKLNAPGCQSGIYLAARGGYNGGQNTRKEKIIYGPHTGDGGAGFIGSHLVERLLGQGHEVICLDNYFTGSRRTWRTCGNTRSWR